jgi:hypothetical protein
MVVVDRGLKDRWDWDGWAFGDGDNHVIAMFEAEQSGRR